MEVLRKHWGAATWEKGGGEETGQRVSAKQPAWVYIAPARTHTRTRTCTHTCLSNTNPYITRTQFDARRRLMKLEIVDQMVDRAAKICTEFAKDELRTILEATGKQAGLLASHENIFRKPFLRVNAFCEQVS